MIDLIVRPLAEDDIASAREWYEGEEPGLGDQFYDDLRHTIRRIREMPNFRT